MHLPCVLAPLSHSRHLLCPLPQKHTLTGTEIVPRASLGEQGKVPPSPAGVDMLRACPYPLFLSFQAYRRITLPQSLAVRQGHVTSSEQLVVSRSDVTRVTSKMKHILAGLRSSRSPFHCHGKPGNILLRQIHPR